MIRLSGDTSRFTYPSKLRRVSYHDKTTAKTFSFLTNHLSLPALTIAELYQSRWNIEVFFKWIKQNLRIKAFYGCSENAIKTQIWMAVSTYVLLAIAKEKLGIEASLYSFVQLLGMTVFEKPPFLTCLRTLNPIWILLSTLTDSIYSTCNRIAVGLTPFRHP
jgi:hypothetical protein